MVNFYNDENVADTDKWKRLTSLGNVIVRKGIAVAQAGRSFNTL